MKADILYWSRHDLITAILDANRKINKARVLIESGISSPGIILEICKETEEVLMDACERNGLDVLTDMELSRDESRH